MKHTCEVCNELFSPRSGEKERKYCSHKCYWESKKGKANHLPFGKIIICPICGKEKYKYPRDLKRVKIYFCSRECAYISFKGQHHSPKTELRRGIDSKENHYNWQGGITPEHQRIRGSFRYKKWQDKVKKRDGECQNCGDHRMSYLMAHHIKNFAKYTNLRFVVKNGITFFRPCHKLFHGKYGYKNNTQ